MAGRPITFDEIEPWPKAVDGAELLIEVAVAIRSYVVMDPTSATRRPFGRCSLIFTTYAIMRRF